ncbi:MAG: preprotein translocase subunit SecE [Candidatus Liptonbacteria bacterium]
MNKIIAKIKVFLMEARQEFKHVNWPTRAEAIRLTIIVICISLGLAVFLGAADYGFSFGLKSFLLD